MTKSYVAALELTRKRLLKLQIYADEHRIIKIVTSTKITPLWPRLLMELFTFAALQERSRRVVLVLPLQKMVWTYELEEWKLRARFLEEYNAFSPAHEDDQGQIQGAKLYVDFPIGYHLKKLKMLSHTLRLVRDGERPYQVIFSRSWSMKMSDEDVEQSRIEIRKRDLRIYVHAPYLVNLCQADGQEENQKGLVCLEEHLNYAKRFGARGVVVHVGKSTQMELSVAMENQRRNIMRILKTATRECPLLLETPAGQGTETLTDMAEFIQFVKSFNSDSIAICLDTCHVFACGIQPNIYLEALLPCHKLRLAHFNDSEGLLGSRVDRHASLGHGRIALNVLKGCAQLCLEGGIDMLHE